MIDLGKFKEVTVVLKLQTQFSKKRKQLDFRKKLLLAPQYVYLSDTLKVWCVVFV